LREKHSEPVVVDIIDSHDVFKNQWKKRRAFYKKENYKIIYTTSTAYTTDLSKWTTVFEPGTKCFKNKTEKSVKLEKLEKSEKTNKKNNSSRSCTDDSESEEEETETVDTKNKNDLLCGKCLIKLK